MGQASLHTARLELVPLADAHFPYEVELDSSPEVVRYMVDGRPQGPEAVLADHRARLAAASGGLRTWVGLTSGVFAGWWSLVPTARPGEAELGYRLLLRWWRQGLASEGARELVWHGFADLGLQRITAKTMAVNAGSRAVMVAAGLSYVRTFHLRFDDPIPGTEEGEVEYAVTAAGWAVPR